MFLLIICIRMILDYAVDVGAVIISKDNFKDLLKVNSVNSRLNEPILSDLKSLRYKCLTRTNEIKCLTITCSNLQSANKNYMPS